LARVIFDRVVDKVLIRLLKDRFEENLWELVIGIHRMTPHILMETELRAEMGGEVLERPLGGVVRVSDYSGIAFNPAQLVRPPLGPLEEIDTSVLLGPRAARPLQLQHPILLGALSYGIAINANFARAF